MKREPIATAVVTFHREGILAHTTLRSYAVAREVAEMGGITINMVLVLDNCSEETRRVVVGSPLLREGDEVVECAYGDAAAARNFGIGFASGGTIFILDGDDYVSQNYFGRHLDAMAQAPTNSILHPEMVVCFGEHNTFGWQIHQPGEYYDPYSLVSINPWISAVCASRETFQRMPYTPCYPSATGFGFEDWHWNLDAISKGFVHHLAWGSAYFYRRKATGSLNEQSNARLAVVPKCAYFDQLLVEAPK
jgi:hypothetical protein